MIFRRLHGGNILLYLHWNYRQPHTGYQDALKYTLPRVTPQTRSMANDRDGNKRSNYSLRQDEKKGD